MIQLLVTIENKSLLPSLREAISLLRGVSDITTVNPSVEKSEDYMDNNALLESIRNGLMEVKAARESGVKLQTAEELLNEL